MTKNNITPVSVRFNTEEKEMLANYAKAEDLSMSQVIRKAVREYFKRKESANLDTIIG